MGKTKTVVIGETLDKKKPKKADKKTRVPGLKGGERVVAVGTREPVTEEAKEELVTQKQVRREPKVRGTKYKDARAKIDRNKLYPISKAIALVKGSSYSTFDGTVELHLVVKKAGTTTRITLPHSAGKQKKIEFADEKTIEKLENGKVDFDVLLATPEMMPRLVPFAKVLGPKGMMPNPKNGTLIKDKADANLPAQAGKFSPDALTLKTEKRAPIIHTTIGKVSQKDKELIENAEAILTAVKAQALKCYLTATMSPSVKIDLS